MLDDADYQDFYYLLAWIVLGLIGLGLQNGKRIN